MAPDEYATGGGGKLKLKGSKVSDGRVEKKKKKKGSKKKDDVKPTEEGESGSGVQEDRDEERAKSEDKDSLSDARSGSVGKTETERKHEEMRKKRVCILVLFFYVVYLKWTGKANGFLDA